MSGYAAVKEAFRLAKEQDSPLQRVLRDREEEKRKKEASAGEAGKNTIEEKKPIIILPVAALAGGR